jgi:hypothetical protein
MGPSKGGETGTALPVVESQDWAAGLRCRWLRWRSLALALVITLMAVGAVQRLTDGFMTLLWRDHPAAAVDLRLRYRELHLWFEGTPIYVTRPKAVYPPATYAGLWPFLGWVSMPAARWLWGLTSAGALVWLAYLVVRGSGARSGLQLAFMALLPLSIYATRATLVNGQLILHTLPPLLAGLLLLHGPPRSWRTDLGAAALLLAGSLKPSIAIPFAWLVLIGVGSMRPAILFGVGYAGLTLLADAFQPLGTLALLHAWSASSVQAATWVAARQHANVHTWLTNVGLRNWGLAGSLAIGGLLGWWTYCCRRVDIWVQLGAASLVARFWASHARYDDVLMLVPMVALARLAVPEPGGQGRGMVAGALLAADSAVMLAPGRLFFMEPFWTGLFEATQSVVWLATLLFLIVSGWLAREGTDPLGAVRSARQ